MIYVLKNNEQKKQDHLRPTGTKTLTHVLWKIIIKNKNTLQLWDRRVRRNSSLQAVFDTPIPHITGCVSSLMI